MTNLIPLCAKMVATGGCVSPDIGCAHCVLFLPICNRVAATWAERIVIAKQLIKELAESNPADVLEVLL